MTESGRVRCVCLIACACGLLLIGCGQRKATQSGETSFPRDKTLYLAGFVWSPPSSFNPLNNDPTYPMTGDVFLVYESLFGYNMLTGELEGILAREYSLSGDTLTIVLNENAKWHDGDPVTSEDVYFTFELHRKYNTNQHSDWQYFDKVKPDGLYRVKFVLSKVRYNPLIMKEILATTLILPKKAFKAMEDRCIAEVKTEKKGAASADDVYEKINTCKNDSQPLASGPYSLHAYSDQKVVLKRFDNYWGNVMHNGRKLSPEFIVYPIFKSNDAGNLALVQGDCDMSMNFIPQIYNRFKKGIGTWYKEKPYFVPGTIVCLLMQMTKSPFKDVEFRRAVAHAINYDQVRNLSIYGYAPALKPGLVLPYGPEKQYYNEEDAAAYGVSYDPARAREILRQAGYRWGDDSMLVGQDGKKLGPFYATCPNGWTDWESTLHIVVSGLRDIGIDVREKLVEEAVWFKDNLNGEFDFTMYQPLDYQSAATPWERFNRTMSSAEWAPPGEVMYFNTERYRDAAADSLLDAIPKIKDDASVKLAYRALNVKFMKELPVVPLMYRPWNFYEFSTKHWNNFPTSENPYSPPQWLSVGAGIKGLWEISPKGK
jgi:peptide/nickel transport system substrate-binding protein